MTKVSIDFETKSRDDLFVCGADHYARHPSTDMLCVSWAKDDDEPQIWHPAFPRIEMASSHEEEMPPDLRELVEDDDVEFHAWNAQFEMLIWMFILFIRYGWPMVPLERWRCTQAIAAAFALPLKLEGCAKVLRSPFPKDMDGNRLMKKMSKPRRLLKAEDPTTANPWHENPIDLSRLFAYCMRDVKAERWIGKQLRPLTPAQLEVWQLDQKINRRGVAVDLPVCAAAAEVADTQNAFLDAETRRITNNAASGTKAVKACRTWMAERGVTIPNLRAENVLEWMKLDEEARRYPAGGEPEELLAKIEKADLGTVPFPDDVRELLKLRQRGSLTSVAKFRRFLVMVCPDGRFRGAYQYHGARTGRAAGRGVQIQNLKRGPAGPQEETLGYLLDGGLELLSLLYSKPIDRLSKSVRGALIAPPGKDLVAGDLAAVEARGVFWLAGQEDALDAYRQGRDIYCEMAEDIFKRPWEDIKAGHEADDYDSSFQRFVGKQTVLGCGYGMGAVKFIGTCHKYGVTVEHELAQRAIDAYRARFTKVKQLWKVMERAAKRAVERPGHESQGPKTRWKIVGRFLHCKLPSGRLTSFYAPRLREHRVRHKGKEWDTISLEFQGLRNNHWGRIRTYGGDIVEGVVQGFCADMLFEGMLRMDRADEFTVMHSHDEAVCEVDEDDEGAEERLAGHLGQVPEWAPDLPVAVSTWRGKRYRKD